MRYTNYIKNDLLNGIGIGCTLWVTRCSHACTGCFNNKKLSDRSGDIVGTALLATILADLSQPHVTRFTWSGGDPAHPANREEVIAFSRRIKEELPEISIWLYTGYTLQEMCDDEGLKDVLGVIDVLVDGKFEQSKKVAGKLYGSSNPTDN